MAGIVAAALDGAPLSYTDTRPPFPDAPTVLVLHGGPGGSSAALQRHLAPLAAAARLVFFDQRGCGESSQATPLTWNLAAWTSDAKTVLHSVVRAPCWLLGQSFGGYLALKLAADLPQQVRGLVLSSAQLSPDRAASIKEFSRLGGARASEAAAAFFAGPSQRTYQDYERYCLPLYNPSRTAEVSVPCPEVLIHFWRSDGYRHLDMQSVASRIRQPALGLAGEFDPIIPPRRTEELIARLGTPVPRKRFLLLKDAGHGPYRDQPSSFIHAVSQFLIHADTHRPTGG